jgi:fatty-acyl-CoA synthase
MPQPDRAVAFAPTDATPAKTAPEGGAGRSWLRALELTARIGDAPLRTFPCVVDELADRFGEATALIDERGRWGFRELAWRANRYARWALSLKLAAGEVVCLLMPNRADYLAIWLGLSKVGVVVALLNTNLRGAALAHCIIVSGGRRIIAAAELAQVLASARAELPEPLEVWTVPSATGRGAPPDGASIELDRLDGAPLAAAERRPVTLADRALLIYTSGTTGLPKAANVSHHRVMAWTHWFAGMTDAGPDDRMFNCLPMYHSIGGVVATGSVLVGGGSVVIREKFSASRFWDDIAANECTLFQYIGELCRYLVEAPRVSAEARHRLRLACGNGLRGDVWEAFQRRFAIPRILEFYAATEGNFSLYNAEGRPGSIGRVPPFMAHRSPIAIVRFDEARGEPTRGEDGHCLRCGPDEPGEAIGRIAGRGDPAGRFEGYTDEAASERKVLRDVFAKGDAWLRTGDLMRRDRQGFFYFVDRVGDTFRWKGENVSTSEVAQAIASCPGVVEANVYGVAVPGAEGRAGMAALRVDASFDARALRAHLLRALPDYACPLFLRITDAIAVTDTFKHKKNGLAEEGFDPCRIADLLFFDDRGAGSYVPLDRTLFDKIASGRIRL